MLFQLVSMTEQIFVHDFSLSSKFDLKLKQPYNQIGPTCGKWQNGGKYESQPYEILQDSAKEIYQYPFQVSWQLDNYKLLNFYMEQITIYM